MPRMKNVNKVVTVVSPESSGKTTLSMQMADKVMKEGGIVSFVDTEHQLDKNLIGTVLPSQPTSTVDKSITIHTECNTQIEPTEKAGDISVRISDPKYRPAYHMLVDKTGKTTEVKMKRTRKTKSNVKLDFYKKYHHVVLGSIRDPSKSDLKIVTKSHGKVCDVKCVDCKKVFTINTQDAFQCVRCDECKVKQAKKRRSEHSKKRSSKRRG
jgi:hypothetical protein